MNFRFTGRRKNYIGDESEHSLKTFSYTVGGIVYCSDISTSVTEIEVNGARTFNIAASTALIKNAFAELTDEFRDYIVDGSYVMNGDFAYTGAFCYADIRSGYAATDYVLAKRRRTSECECPTAASRLRRICKQAFSR